MSKKLKVGIILSVLWGFTFTLSFAVFVGSHPEAAFLNLFVGYVPLIVAWGIWWVRKD